MIDFNEAGPQQPVAKRPLQCDLCGRFIPWQDIQDGLAVYRLLYAANDLVPATYETFCRVHAHRGSNHGAAGQAPDAT